MENVWKWVNELSLGSIMQEMAVFSKWIYRYRNQQRRHKTFQKLVQIERDIKKYYQIDVKNTINKTITSCINTSERVIRPLVLKQLLSQVTDYVIYVARLIDFMESAFRELHQKILIGHLLYSYLLAAAGLSRLWFYSRLHMWALCEVRLHLSKLSSETSSETGQSSFDWRTVLDDQHLRYLPLAMRPNKNSKVATGDSGLLEISSELKAKREKDFDLTTKDNTIIDESVACRISKGRRKRKPNVFRFNFRGNHVTIRSRKFAKLIRRESPIRLCSLSLIKRKWFQYYFVHHLKLQWKPAAPPAPRRNKFSTSKMQRAFENDIDEAFNDVSIIDKIFEQLEKK